MPEHCMYCGSQTWCDCRDERAPSRALQFEYDLWRDVLTVEGVKYAGGLFRYLGSLGNVGDCFQIMGREDGTVWVRRIATPADSADYPCPKCAGTGYVRDAISGRRVECQECYQDNGLEEPR